MFIRVHPWLAENWRSHVDLHHEPSPSQGEMQNSYTLRACRTRSAECGTRNFKTNGVGFNNSALLVPRSALETACPGWIRTINIRCQRPAFCWLNYRAWRSWPDSHRLTTGLKGPPLDCLALTNEGLAHEAGIAPASPRLQRGANLSQLLVAGPSAR